MVEHAEQVGSPEDSRPKNTASTDELNRRRTISFKVGHAILTVFLLWLMWVILSQTSGGDMLTGTGLFI